MKKLEKPEQLQAKNISAEMGRAIMALNESPAENPKDLMHQNSVIFTEFLIKKFEIKSRINRVQVNLENQTMIIDWERRSQS